MRKNAVVKTVTDCTALLNLPPDHVLNRQCSFFYRVSATEETYRIRLSDMLFTLYGEHYRQWSKQNKHPVSIHQVWIGLYTNAERVRDKIADHKRKQGEAYTPDHEKRTISDMKKKTCGAVLPFGTITPKKPRTAENFDTITGVFPVDFDEIPSDKFHEIRAALQKDKHIVFLFESITRGRLKGAVLLPQTTTAPQQYFSSIEKYFLKKYGLQIDTGCKDSVRLMFGSYDCEPFVNLEPVMFPMTDAAHPSSMLLDVESAMPKASGGDRKSEKIKIDTAVVFDNEPKPEYKPIETTGLKYGTPQYYTFAHAEGIRTAQRVTEAIEKQNIVIADTYDEWLRIAFAIANGCGEQGRTYFHRISRQSSKYDAADCDAKYDNVLRTHDGKIQIGSLVHIAKERGVKLQPAATNGLIYEKSAPSDFWRVVIDETGKKKTQIKIEYAAFYDFLRSHGFARVNVRGVTPQPILCRIVKGIAEEQTPQQVREYVAFWIYNNVPDKLSGGVTRSMLIEEITNRTKAGKDSKDSSLLSDNHLHTNLLTEEYDAHVSDFDTVRIPYENGMLEITAEGMQLKPYVNSSGSVSLILKSNVLPRAFKVPTADEIARANSDATPFGCFVRALSGYYSVITSDHDEQCKKRWQAIRNAMAYAIHDYKTTDNRKMVIFVDDFDYKDYGKANGGTGKTLLLLALSHMRAAVLIDSKNADFARPMTWQQLRPSTRIVLLDDPVQDFDLRDLYSMITTGPIVERKYHDPWQYEIGNHPRVVMASNYGVRTDAQHSSERRVWHVEIAKYFGQEKGAPSDDSRIGWLYENWTAEQWYDFDVFFASACQDYLKQDRKTACTPVNTQKIMRANLARNTHAMFVDEIEKIMLENGPEQSTTSESGPARQYYRFVISDTCERLTEACGFQVKPRTFNSWLNLYADYAKHDRGLTFTEVRPSERTRNGYGQQIRTTLLILETI